MGFGLSSSDPLRDALDVLTEERGLAAELSERTIRLRDAVKGDPRLAALRVLGVAQTASPVGAAAFGPEGVAAAVWSAPELYLVGWTATNRWLVGYRLTGGAGPNDYVRSEGRIPSHLEIGNWYQDAPEEASAAFAGVGLSLGTPPFPLPEAPPPPPAATRNPQLSPPARRTRSSPAAPSPGRTPRVPRAPKPPPPARLRSTEDVASRVCAGCNMRRMATQFVDGSDLCVDCR